MCERGISRERKKDGGRRRESEGDRERQREGNTICY